MGSNVTVHEGKGARRSRQVNRVLITVLALNLCIAAVKFAYGTFAGLGSIRADGIHSLFDSVADLVALIGSVVSSRPADSNHPYGHGKYETYASVFIGVVLLFAAWSIGSDAIKELMAGESELTVSVTSFAVMLVTLAINLTVTTWERQTARRLTSDVLAADAKHTATDVLVTLGVLASLVLVRLGFGQADAVMSLIVAVVIAVTAFTIFMQANSTLSDTVRIPPEQIREVVCRQEGVRGCHEVRTRGSESEVYVDLHMLVDGAMRIDEAHSLADRVEQQLKEEFSQIADVVVHIEPDTPGQRAVSSHEREHEEREAQRRESHRRLHIGDSVSGHDE